MKIYNTATYCTYKNVFELLLLVQNVSFYEIFTINY